MKRTHREQVASIPNSRTRPELLLAAELETMGYTVVVGRRVAAVKVDIVLPDVRAAVFVDGCFWHGCPDHYVRPRSNEAFWAAKLQANVRRDQAQTTKLKAEFWNVLRIWEHEVLRDPARAAVSVLDQCESAGVTVPNWRVIRVHPVPGSLPEVEERHQVDLQEPTKEALVTRARTTRKR